MANSHPTWAKKFRLRKACSKGHPYTKESTYWHRGIRHCKICRNEWQRVYYEKKLRHWNALTKELDKIVLPNK